MDRELIVAHMEIHGLHVVRFPGDALNESWRVHARVYHHAKQLRWNPYHAKEGHLIGWIKDPRGLRSLHLPFDLLITTFTQPGQTAGLPDAHNPEEKP